MLETTTPPKIDRGFLDLVLDHCKVDSGDEESAYADLVEEYTAAALDKIESASGRMLFTRTCKLTLDAFSRSISLPVSPVIAVTGISYIDTAGGEQTLPSASCALLDRLERPYLIPAYGHSWPDTWDFPGAVKITFTAGYAGADNSPDLIPAQLRMAAMQTVADWMRFGGNVVTTSLAPLPADARRACMNFRRVWA